MAISTYSELQAAIAAWVDRTDLTAVIPDFIRLAERTIQAELRTSVAESSTDLATVAGTESVSVPADFNGVRNVYVDGNTKQPLAAVALEQLRRSVAGSTSGKPEMYAISGSSLVLAPTPDAVYTLTLDYHGFSQLSDAAPTNAMLTHYPDVYLRLSLVETARYLQMGDQVTYWQALADMAIDAAKREDRAIRWGGLMQTRPRATA